MAVYYWIAVSCFIIFLLSFSFGILFLLFKKEKTDFAPSKGNVPKAIWYSFTSAMSPLKKESAYLHLPTYTAGLIYHFGTFFSFIIVLFIFFKIHLPAWFEISGSILLCISIVCGLGILLKRIIKHEIRSFSHTDDYFSNILVTGFHFIVLLYLIRHEILLSLYLIYFAFLFLYIPIGKLKHSFYFFSARIYLSKFYGKRGVWPIKERK